MAELLQFVSSGLTVGAIYALVALGFTLIYKASDSSILPRVSLSCWAE